MHYCVVTVGHYQHATYKREIQVIQLTLILGLETWVVPFDSQNATKNTFSSLHDLGQSTSQASKIHLLIHKHLHRSHSIPFPIWIRELYKNPYYSDLLMNQKDWIITVSCRMASKFQEVKERKQVV